MQQEPDDIIQSGPAFSGPLPVGFGYREGETVDFGKIGAYDWFDLTLRFNVNDNLTFTAAVQNLFDKDPPVVGSSIGTTSYNSGNTYPSTYDALGRRFAVSARIKF
jgi:outer membrane receptor protein involved in Fe transport